MEEEIQWFRSGKQVGYGTTRVYHHHHHHHVVPLARHFFLSSIASGRSWGLHSVSSHGCCMYVRAAFARPYVAVHRSTSHMSSSLLLQQCPVCLLRLTWIVFVMGGRWQLVGALWGYFVRKPFKNVCLEIKATDICFSGWQPLIKIIWSKFICVLIL